MSDDPLSPTALRLAVGVVALLAVGVVAASLVLSSDSDQATEQPNERTDQTAAPRTGPLAVVGVNAPEARSAPCAALIDALPATLPDNGKTLRTLPIAKPRPPATTAWGGDRGEPIVLRCGLGKPAELTPTAALREISRVRWLPVAGAGATTWYVVDRAVYVALTVPDGTGTGPLQDVSAAVGTLPAQPVQARG